MKQKGIITYGISSNRQNAFAGAAHDAIFNTWRRFSSQVLYWAPPFIGAYLVMDWAIKRYGYVESNVDRARVADTSAGTSISIPRLVAPSLRVARESKETMSPNHRYPGTGMC